MKLADVIDELVEERGLNKTSLGSIVCEGMLAAYQRKYPDFVLKVKEDSLTGDLVVLAQGALWQFGNERSAISLSTKSRRDL